MRTLRIDQLERRILATPTLREDRVPKPFPGNSPTRVAWSILADFGTQQTVRADERRPGQVIIDAAVPRLLAHSYVGKPCRYRALEALNFLSRARAHGRLMSFWQTEFDSAGPVVYEILNAAKQHSDAYYAYHPQGGVADPLQAFAKPVFLKRIGKFPTYSHQKKLSQEQIDQFYAWWEERFSGKANLKRPRKKAAKSTPVVVAPLEVPEVAIQGGWNFHVTSIAPAPTVRWNEATMRWERV